MRFRGERGSVQGRALSRPFQRCFALVGIALAWPHVLWAQQPSAEVVVVGRRPAPGAVTVTRDTAREMPGAFGDPARAFGAEPGVVPIASGLPYYFVRGAPPANVGFFLDGIDIPLMFHAFVGPAVVHPAFINRLDMHFGAAPVRYGRFAGPVLAAELPRAEASPGGEINVRAIDSSAFVHGPFGPCDSAGDAECSPGSALLAGRYSYTGPMLSLLGDTTLDYWDYQALVSYRTSTRDTLSLLALGARDFFDAGRTGLDEVDGETQFHRADLRWDHRIGAAGNLRIAVTAGSERSGDRLSAVTGRSLRVRTAFDEQLTPAVRLELGLDGRLDERELDAEPTQADYADLLALFPSRRDHALGAYLALAFDIDRVIRVIPGLRADLYQSRGQTALGVDPRIQADFRLGTELTLFQSLGVSHQRPDFVAQLPAAHVADLDGGLQRAVLASSGLRYRLPAQVLATASVFRAAYFNALDPIGDARDFSLDRGILQRRTAISAIGLELKLQRALTRDLGGFVAYTLSRTVQARGAHESVSGFDRPHVLQAALSYDMGMGTRAALRGSFYSGVPARILNAVEPYFSAHRRGPAYARLDVRLEKRFELGRERHLSLVAELLNATASEEVLGVDCGNTCNEERLGPIVLPSLGVEAKF